MPNWPKNTTIAAVARYTQITDNSRTSLESSPDMASSNRNGASVMDTFRSLKVFREVVEMNSFNGAAKRIGISTAMVSKHIAHLEATQRTRLLNRTSRSISLTDSGRLYYKSCREALDILEEAEAILGHHNGTASGTLRVTAPQWFSNPEFARLLMDYQETYPKVDVELMLDNQRLDLVTGRYDLALRVTDKPSPSLIVRPLANINFILVGSPDYFAKTGRPTSTQDLNSHNLILPVLTEVEGLEVRKDQEADNLGAGRLLRTNDTTLMLQLAWAGFGMAYVPHWLATRELQSGRLELAIDNSASFSRTLYVVYKNRNFLAPKIRTFIDFMAARLSNIGLPRSA
ncbi:hypothetical protein XhyaCFBP1156_13945 [Xanthomonas hyacinthi]|uniref:HTH lysR-type domain-containing protein n=2 Tax=Xanthomonas hyacinthi TaxID=56455 RepID=A0A2S7EUL5_9XANT|nr:hypothetical protein XhyaCFBP1156_13945 [Xanthomonas hyacinthi]